MRNPSYYTIKILFLNSTQSWFWQLKVVFGVSCQSEYKYFDQREVASQAIHQKVLYGELDSSTQCNHGNSQVILLFQLFNRDAYAREAMDWKEVEQMSLSLKRLENALQMELLIIEKRWNLSSKEVHEPSFARGLYCWVSFSSYAV